MNLARYYINRAGRSWDKRFLGSTKALRSGLLASQTKATFTTELIAAVLAESILKLPCGGSWRPGLAGQTLRCGKPPVVGATAVREMDQRLHMLGTLSDWMSYERWLTRMQSCINEMFKRNANTAMEDLDLGDQQLRGGLKDPEC